MKTSKLSSIALFLIINLLTFTAYARDIKSADVTFPWQNDHYSGTCTTGDKTCVYFSPQDLPVEAVKAYLNSAKKKIRIATYNMSIKEFADILRRKANEGVKVEFMVDYKLSYSNKLWDLIDGHKYNIEKIRVPVMRGGNPQMHNKLIIIDDELLITGSANYSYMGLIANFENVMAITDKRVIKKFNDEINELKALSFAVCNIFSSGGKDRCSIGDGVYDPAMKQYLTKGNFPAHEIDTKQKRCRGLADDVKNYRDKKALLNNINMPVIKDVHLCFRKKSFQNKMQKLISKIGTIERYGNGKLTSQNPKFWEQEDDQAGNPIKAYFSPEDNIEAKIINTLKKTLANPKKSFAYISTNFITNYKITQTLQQMNSKGVRIRAFFDKGRFVDPMFQRQILNMTSIGFFGSEDVINDTLNGMKSGLNFAYEKKKIKRRLEKKATESGLGFIGTKIDEEVNRRFDLQLSKYSNKSKPGSLSNSITIFDNTLTGAWACNHNKWAIIGTEDEVILLNGSANWSGGAMRINGENLMIIRDPQIIAIYMKEMLSQLHIYRYGQKSKAPGFQEDINTLASKSNCLKTLIGYTEDTGCTSKTVTIDGKKLKGKYWPPRIYSPTIITMKDSLNKFYDLPIFDPWKTPKGKLTVNFYDNENFAGKQLSSISVGRNWRFDFWGEKNYSSPNGFLRLIENLE